jgi:hypothetical protein
MVRASLKNIKLLEIIDEATSQTYFGGWQEWYGAWWKRMSGCGPTVASTILSYMKRSGCGDNDGCPVPRSEFCAFMDDVWQFVTPGVMGIPSTEALMKGAASYIRERRLDIRLEELDIPKNKLQRPGFQKLLDYLAWALNNDSPVAFLSLDKGQEDALDSWHWVTLLTLEYEPDGSAAVIGVADEGKYFTADLKKWYDTTSMGGGFVRFVPNTLREYPEN